MNRFGFIAHPIDLKTFKSCARPWCLLKELLYAEVFQNMLTKLPPRRYCSFNNIKSTCGTIIEGEMLTIPLLPKHIASLPEELVLKLIEKCIKYCEQNGANLVGLGGFTSVVGNEGEVLSKRTGVPLTSGNTLTAALALEGITKAAYIMDLSLSSSVAAIIGATGDIGSICTKLLSKKVKKINIAARNETKLQDFADVITKYGNATVEVFKYTKDAARSADIILSATSAVTTIIEPEYLKSGAIVCDVSLPANIAREVVRIRNDIFVFEGGIAKINNLDGKNIKIGDILPKNSLFGCVAETIALTFERRFESYSIGRGNITEGKIYEIKNIAESHGITLSDFFCGYKFYTDRDIDTIKKNVKRNREKTYVA